MSAFRPTSPRSCLVALLVFFGLSPVHANITIVQAGKTTVPVPHSGPPTPTTPGDLAITTQAGNQITLAWTAAIAPAGRTIARYDVFLNGIKIASATDSNISLTSDPDGPLLQFFTVQAIDNRGSISPLSAEILVRRTNEPLYSSIQVKYAFTGQNSKDGVIGPTGKSFTTVNYSHEKLADEFTTEGVKIGHRENRLTIAESFDRVARSWTSVVSGTSDVTRTESYYSLPAVVQHSDWQLQGNRAVLGGSLSGSMTLPSVAIPSLPGGVSTVTGTTAIVSDSTVLLYNLEGGGYFNVPHGTLTRNETYALSYSSEFTDAMVVTKMLRDYVIAKAGAAAVPWPDFDSDVSANADNGILLAASPVTFWDGRPSYCAELVGYRNSQNPAQGSLYSVSGQGSTYRLHTERSGPAHFRWIEVFSPYFYGPQGPVTTGPDLSVFREEAVAGGPTGAISREYVLDPPTSFGGTRIVTLEDGISVRTPAMAPSPGAPRLYLKNAIFRGEAAQIDFTNLNLGQMTGAMVRVTGDTASVRLVAVELSIVADQGMAAALAQGVVIAPGTDLIAESHQILAGRWQLVAVGLTAGTANVTLEITNSGVTYGLGTAIAVYPTLGLAVDANRDGTIAQDTTDATSAMVPFRFWLNDDNDFATTSNLWSDPDPEQYPPSTPDSGNQFIDSPRDCEDLARLWISVPGLIDTLKDQASDLYLGLKWKNTSGTTPSIHLFRSADVNGGLGHIKDAAVATAQAKLWTVPNAPAYVLGDADAQSNVTLTTRWSAGGIFEVKPQTAPRAADFIFRKDALADVFGTRSTGYLLFEAVQEGKGELVVVIVRKKSDNSWELVSEGGSSWLQLDNIRRMYVRAHSLPLPENFPHPWQANTPAPSPYEEDLAQEKALSIPDSRLWYGAGDSIENPSQFPFIASPGEQNKCVIFVHGIDMNVPEMHGYTHSFFKRLWWEGYRGRFVSFRWCTPLSSDGVFGWEDTDENTSIYNSGEYRSWKGGSSLKKFADALRNPASPFYFSSNPTMGLLAHSLGNACAGEALRQGMQVNSYVALKAAVPLSCYYPVDTPAPVNQTLADADALHPTPQYAGFYNGYHGYLSSIGGSNKVNYYGATDFWLATGSASFGMSVSWVNNEAKRKPDDPWDHWTNSSLIKYLWDVNQLKAYFRRDAFYRRVTDPHECMAFVSRPRTSALGAQSPPSGFSGLDLESPSTYGFGRERFDHSGPFQRNIQLMYGNQDGIPWSEPLYVRLMRDLQVAP